MVLNWCHWVERRKDLLLSEIREGKNFQAEKQGNLRKGERGGLKSDVEYMAKKKTRLAVMKLPPKKWTERKPDSFCSAATKTCWEFWNTLYHYERTIENRSKKC